MRQKSTRRRNLNADAKAMAEEMDSFLKNGKVDVVAAAFAAADYCSWRHAAGPTKGGQYNLAAALRSQSLHRIVALVAKLSFFSGQLHALANPKEARKLWNMQNPLPAQYIYTCPWDAVLLCAEKDELNYSRVLEILTHKRPALFDCRKDEKTGLILPLPSFPKMAKGQAEKLLKKWKHKEWERTPKKAR